MNAVLTTLTTGGTFKPKHEVSRVYVVGRVDDGLTPDFGDLGIFVCEKMDTFSQYLD